MSTKKGQLTTLFLLGVLIVGGYVIWQKKLFFFDRRDTVYQDPSEMIEDVQDREHGLPADYYQAEGIDFRDVINAIGNIKGFQEVDINFEVQGVLDSFPFAEGEEIRKGEIVAELNPRDYSQKVGYALTKMRAAETELERKDKELQMYESLYELGSVIQLKLDQVELEKEQARLEVEAKRRELEFAEMEMDKTRFYVPFDCLLGSQLAEEGELVTPATKVGVLLDTSKVVAEVGVIERDAAKMGLGQSVNLFIDAYPGQIFSGTIFSVRPMVAEKSRTLLVKVIIDNPGRLLLSGMFTRAEIVVFEKSNAVIVPTRALFQEEESVNLYVINEDSRAEKRSVELGYATNDYADIIAGLSPGEKVILNPREISPGMLVKGSDSGPLSIY